MQCLCDSGKYHIAGKFGERKLWRIYCDTILAREKLVNLLLAK